MKFRLKTKIFFITSCVLFLFYFVINFTGQIGAIRYHFGYTGEIISFALREFILPVSLVLFIFSLVFFIKDSGIITYDKKEKNDIEQLRNRLIKDDKSDIKELMLSNMSEIRKYYSMSKTHASLSFILSILFCVFGFCLLAYTVSIDIQQATIEPVVVGIIGGTVSELFAGTALFVHKSSLSQLNFYYKALHENERMLLSIHLVDMLEKEEEKNEMLKSIINSSLDDIKHMVKKDI